MAKKKKEKKRVIVTPKEKKSVLTAFILLFPSMILAGLTTVEPSFKLSLLAIALFFYQAILLKSFVDDHYSMS